ncbi:unnamed protein product [Spodoptera exigua]|nr:unnamed protein product [Spodoptera exigua]
MEHNEKSPIDQKSCDECEEPEIDKEPPCPSQCPDRQCKAYQTKSKFDPETKPIVWIIGGPGSGKFTQCAKMVETYGFTHLSTGDLIREEVKAGTPRAKCLGSIVERVRSSEVGKIILTNKLKAVGGLVPNDVVLAILKDAMEEAAKKGTHGYLIDGYPREKSQGEEFERTIGPVTLILYLEASPRILCCRLLGRAEASTEDNRRLDDKYSVIKLRIATFIENNQGILERYGNKVKRINAEQSPDDIFLEVRTYLEPVVAQAALMEAEKKQAEAEEKMKAVGALPRSSMPLARFFRPKSVDVDSKRLAAVAEVADAEARVTAARNAAEAARARLEEFEERNSKNHK